MARLEGGGVVDHEAREARVDESTDELRRVGAEAPRRADRARGGGAEEVERAVGDEQQDRAPLRQLLHDRAQLNRLLAVGLDHPRFPHVVLQRSAEEQRPRRVRDPAHPRRRHGDVPRLETRDELEQLELPLLVQRADRGEHALHGGDEASARLRCLRRLLRVGAARRLDPSAHCVVDQRGREEAQRAAGVGGEGDVVVVGAPVAGDGERCARQQPRARVVLGGAGDEHAEAQLLRRRVNLL